MLRCITLVFLAVFFPTFRGDLSVAVTPGQGTAELLQSFRKGGCEHRGEEGFKVLRNFSTL